MDSGINMSGRVTTYAVNGMVASSQHLASQAGLEMLKKGGNAVDAAIAAAAMLIVTEPTSNGFGGDAFAQVWFDGKLYGLNSSGFAPKLMSYDYLKNKGYNAMPERGWDSVTVPGIPAAWAELSARFGKLSFSELLEPAIYYAENGFAVTTVIAKNWSKDFAYYSKIMTEKVYKPFFELFTDNGRTPEAGEIWKFELHGKTLRELAATKCESFYRGRIADKIDEYSKATGGCIRKSDLAAFNPEWVEPLSINYRGYDIWELPPNGHGITALTALNIFKNFKTESRTSAKTYHKLIESMKLAYVDSMAYVAEPSCMKVTADAMLDEAYAYERSRLINDKALLPKAGKPEKGGTVYLCTADCDGNMVSYIQSNYMDFGSGIVIPDTGIALHNRGANFKLDKASVNCVAPLKRPYHTIIPGFITKNKEAYAAFGVMGDFMQPQGHLQVVTDLIDFGLEPQQCLDAPRWRWREGLTVEIEKSFSKEAAASLAAAGHNIKEVEEAAGFGRGQIIVKQGEVYAGGTEPRCDGAVIGY